MAPGGPIAGVGGSGRTAGPGPAPVTVMVCSDEHPVGLVSCVRAVLDGAVVPDELLVVDRSAERNDSVAGMGTVRGCHVRYTRVRRSGLDRSRELGLHAAANSVVILLDETVVVGRDWLQRLLEGVDSDRRRTTTGGRVVVEEHGELASAPARAPDPRPGRRVPVFGLLAAIVGAACLAALAAGWHSPVRVALAIGFLLFGPGLALTDALDVREPFLRLAVAAGTSLAVDTLVAVGLVYAGFYSAERAVALLLGLTLAGLAASVRRGGDTDAPSLPRPVAHP